MAKIAILKVEVCDINKNVLPIIQSGVSEYYKVDFPQGGGNSGELFLRVLCNLTPTNSIQVKFTLKELNLADFEFLMGDGETIQYIREVTHGGRVYLPYRSKCKKPVSQCLPGTLHLSARATINPQNTAKNITLIKAN